MHVDSGKATYTVLPGGDTVLHPGVIAGRWRNVVAINALYEGFNAWSKEQSPYTSRRLKPMRVCIVRGRCPTASCWQRSHQQRVGILNAAAFVISDVGWTAGDHRAGFGILFVTVEAEWRMVR